VKYFVPEIVVPQNGPIAQPARERLGGLPFGLPAEEWPICTDCGRSQSLLAQFNHHRTRLDLGREGRVLFVFQCAHDPGLCSTWEAFSGANACFVIDPEALGSQTTERPKDRPPTDHAVSIVGWVEREDGLDDETVAAFQSDDAFCALPDDVRRRLTWSTRLGGRPRWLQRADEAPRDGWSFVAQLDGTYSFLTPPLHPPEWVKPDPEKGEGRTHWADGPNFGGGLAYLFLKAGPTRPQGCMLSQR
jgi:hypothetical protein